MPSSSPNDKLAPLDPDERLEPAWEDYVAGRDVVFDAVARRIMRLPSQ